MNVEQLSVHPQPPQRRGTDDVKGVHAGDFLVAISRAVPGFVLVVLGRGTPVENHRYRGGVMANLKWEEIESEGTEAFAHRAEVPGGWLVLVQTNVCHQDPNGMPGMHPGWDWRPSLAFVPDPEHAWALTTVTEEE